MFYCLVDWSPTIQKKEIIQRTKTCVPSFESDVVIGSRQTLSYKEDTFSETEPSPLEVFSLNSKHQGGP